LHRVWIALGDFLQEDLSPAYLGITDCARSHLNRFRQFLHDFYEDEFGCWPPPYTTPFPKALYKCLCFDFQSLYDYLVDKESTSDISLQKPPTVGGLCVLQNVNSFDRRHGFKALPYPLPLLPTERRTPRKSESQKTLRQFTLAAQHNKTHQIHATSAALAAATNVPDQATARSKIVEAYMHFERVCVGSAFQRHEKISAIDARKVRWLLIYGTLQHLNSALRAPKEVRDCESPEYPLCCVAEHSSWHTNSKVSTPMVAPTTMPSTIGKDFLVEHQRSLVIEPDCNREDYISSETTTIMPSRQSSFRSLGPRSLSIRSSRSSRRKGETQEATQNYVILNPELEHGSNEAPEFLGPVSSAGSFHSQNSSLSDHSDRAGFDIPWLASNTPCVPYINMPLSGSSVEVNRPRTPILDSQQLGIALEAETFKPVTDAPSRSDSTGSPTSFTWSEPSSATSSNSSTVSEAGTPVKVNSVENSGLLGGFVSVSNILTGKSQAQSRIVVTKAEIPQSYIHPLLRKPLQPNRFDFNFDGTQSESVINAVELKTNDPAIGVAISTVPTRPCLYLQPTELPFRKELRTTGKTPLSTPGTIRAEPVIKPSNTGLKKMRSTQLFSIITSPKNALTRPVTRPESHFDSVDPLDATPPPISISKNMEDINIPPFCFPSKAVSPANTDQKKDRRRSSFWRR